MDDNNNEESILTLDQLLLDEDTNDKFIRCLMGSVVLATKYSQDLIQNENKSELKYLSTIYEFSNKLDSCKNDIKNLISNITQFINQDKSNASHSYGMTSSKLHANLLSDDLANDESVYDHVIDLVDKLLEDANLFMDDASGLKKSNLSKISSLSMSLNKDRILQQQSNIDKPCFKDIDNSRERAFRPRLLTKYNQLKPLNLTERYYSKDNDIIRKSSNYEELIQNGYIMPKYYYDHPYEYELMNLSYKSWQLEEPDQRLYSNQVIQRLKTSIIEEEIPLYENEDELNSMIDELKLCREIAIDLEHHSLRSFQGFTCLIQVLLLDILVEFVSIFILYYYCRYQLEKKTISWTQSSSDPSYHC